MVTWYADGTISGYSLAANTTNITSDAILGLDQDVLHLASAGSVDANGITRLQYDIAATGYRDTLAATVRIKFTTSEVSTATAASKVCGATMFIVQSTAFAAGHIPTPTEILAASPSVYRTTAGGAVGNVNYFVSIIGPNFSVANQKWWVLVVPTTYTSGSTPSVANDVPVGAVNTNGRAISIWTNRTPLPPVITSPAPDSVYGAGSTFDFSFTTTDPDRFFGGTSKAYTDIAGIQVQYAPKGVDSMSPLWADLPIATHVSSPSEQPILGSGYYIERSVNNDPILDTPNGAFYLWAFQTMKVRAAAYDLTSGAGVLPSGDWQIRMRSFDYGHPYPRWKKPLADDTGNTTPDTYPSDNTSDWSDPVNVSVSAQTPAPVALSPINNNAIPVGTDVVLRWKYRNTYTPPLPQKKRAVQIRKVGETDWTMLVSGNKTDAFYDIDSPAANDGSVTPPGPPTSYLSDGDFEAGTTDGWLSTTTGPATLQNYSPIAGHSGTHVLVSGGPFSGSPATVLTYQFIVLNPGDLFMTVDGWVHTGPDLTGVQEDCIVSVFFVDDASTTLSHYVQSMTKGANWVNARFADMAIPTGATKALVQVTGVLEQLNAKFYFLIVCTC